jgi:hypothetical protein
VNGGIADNSYQQYDRWALISARIFLHSRVAPISTLMSDAMKQVDSLLVVKHNSQAAGAAVESATAGST